MHFFNFIYWHLFTSTLWQEVFTWLCQWTYHSAVSTSGPRLLLTLVINHRKDSNWSKMKWTERKQMQHYFTCCWRKRLLFSIVTLWFDFEYEIEYEYDFGISSKFCHSSLLLTRTEKERDKIILLWQTLIWSSWNWFENSYLTQSDTCSPTYSL